MIPVKNWFSSTISPELKGFHESLYSTDRGYTVFIKGESNINTSEFFTYTILREVYEYYNAPIDGRVHKPLYTYFCYYPDDRNEVYQALVSAYNSLRNMFPSDSFFSSKVCWVSEINEIYFPEIDFTIKILPFNDYDKIPSDYSICGVTLEYFAYEPYLSIESIHAKYSEYILPKLLQCNPKYTTWMLLYKNSFDYMVKTGPEMLKVLYSEI